MVMMEAFASGVPVVGTTAGGQVDIVREGKTGMLVAPRSPRELADAIAVCATRPEWALQMGGNARHVVEGMSWDIQVERLYAHLQEVAR